MESSTFSGALKCSFMDCLTPCLVTFIVVFVGVAIANVWIYFRLVDIAKKKYGEPFTNPDPEILGTDTAPLATEYYTPIEQAFSDPYPGIKNLDDVKQEELWRLYQQDPQPDSGKYFNLLSSQFLQKKGFSQKDIKKVRAAGARLKKCQGRL